MMTPKEIAAVVEGARVSVQKRQEAEAARLEAFGEPTAAEGIYAFMGWLSTRSGTLKIGRERDSAPLPALIEAFCRSYHLAPPREDGGQAMLARKHRLDREAAAARQQADGAPA